jgi:hypothetical protein
MTKEMSFLKTLIPYWVGPDRALSLYIINQLSIIEVLPVATNLEKHLRKKILLRMQENFIEGVRKRSVPHVLHARPEVADLLAHAPCKTQSRNQISVLEYATGFERVAEDLRGAYRICAGFKD